MFKRKYLISLIVVFTTILFMAYSNTGLSGRDFSSEAAKIMNDPNLDPQEKTAAMNVLVTNGTGKEEKGNTETKPEQKPEQNSGQNNGQKPETKPNPGNTPVNNNKNNSLSEKEKEAKKIEEALLAKESELTILIKQHEAKLDEIKKLENHTLFNTFLVDQNKYVSIIERKKEEELKQKKEIEKKSKELKKSWNTLGDIYESLESSGDPVSISSGEFIAEYIDYEPMDYLNKFVLKRSLSNIEEKESFGTGWICSLDSRIIRCNSNDFSETLFYLKKQLEILQDIKKKYEDFYGVYKGRYNKENKQLYDNAVVREKECCDKIKFYEEYEQIRIKLQEKNKYVTYGKYKNIENYFGFKNFLIYIDENGNNLFFEYKEDGLWHVVSQNESNVVILKGLDNNGNYTRDLFCDGGYELLYEDGSKKIFSEYGILKKDIDKNNNETSYMEENGYITKIKLKTGEVLNIERNNNNFIKSISGNISGICKYNYMEDNLVEVIDNNGIVNFYTYDNLGKLAEIKKSDNSKIKINYVYNSELKKSVCSSVINENGYEESFSINMSERTFKHNVYNEGFEIYKFDNRGRTNYYSDIFNNKVRIERADDGKLISVGCNGNIKQFIYNNKNKVSEIDYGGISREYFFYNDYGDIIKYINKDNKTFEYKYDKNRNLILVTLEGQVIEKIAYYKNGLVREIEKDDKSIVYKYNNFGSVIEKITTLADGHAFNEIWKYDQANNIIEEKDKFNNIVKFEYEDNKEIIRNDNTERILKYNNRGWLIEESIEELSSGKKYIKQNEYDNMGNIISVFINNKLYTEYEYYKNGILKSFTVWNNSAKDNNEKRTGIKKEYIYNNNWQISKIIKNKIEDNIVVESVQIKNYSYKLENDNLIVTLKEYLKPEIIFTYNYDGKLLRKEYENGYSEYFNYSPAGILLEKKDSNNNCYKINYYEDGSYKIETKHNSGAVTVSLFNKNNSLIKLIDIYGIVYNFEYDSFNQLIKERGPDYIITWGYDNKGRIIEYSLYDKYGELTNQYSVVFNDKDNEEKVYVDDKLKSYSKYDIWGRIIESNNIKGHYFYEYDEFGNCIQTIDCYGNEVSMKYSPTGQIIEKKLSEGTVKEFEYDLSGLIKEIKNNNLELLNFDYGEKSINTINKSAINNIQYDYKGNYKITNYDTGNLIKTKTGKNSFSITDDYGNKYEYIKDSEGRIISEINPLGNKLFFEYDNKGSLVKTIDYNGIEADYFYDRENRKINIKYNTGDNVEIKKNNLNMTESIINNDYEIDYKYDKSGNLISEYSKLTNTLVEYEYDNFGRCIYKKGNNFKFKYYYDDMSQLTRIEDVKSNTWVNFSYDSEYRIKEKKYSNGLHEVRSYNKNGFVDYIIIKNNYGLIIFSNFILYDDYGRIKCVLDKDCNITKYSYDKIGRLVSTEYPYSEEIKQYYLSEALSCGFNYKNENPIKNTITLSTNEKMEFIKLFEKAGVNSFIKSDFNQPSWIEAYSYDKNGNVSEVVNPIGKITYSYDKLNRVIRKNYNNTESFGINIIWNNNNCIERIETRDKVITFKYGINKRPIEIQMKNAITGESEISYYKYDVFGRRVLEKFNDYSIEYIYDGFSTNLLSKQIVNNNYSLAPVINNTKQKDNYLYKTGELESYKEYGTYKYLENNNYKTSENNLKHSRDYRSFNILSFGNTPILISFVDGTKTNNNESNFVINDYKNKYIGITDLKSDFINYCNIDTWGNVISNENGSNFLGNKINDNQFDFIINLGYRDYIPLLKSFSSEDPVRAGKNWYAYCSSDPVNYSDDNGYYKQSLTKSQQCHFHAEMMNYCTFNKDEYDAAGLKNEEYLGLSNSYDCADTSIAVNVYAAKNAGINLNSEIANEFSEAHNNHNYSEAKTKISSSSMINSPDIRKTIEGADYEYIKYSNEIKNNNSNKNNYDEEKYKEELARQKKLEDTLSSPGNISPGTVIAMSNSSVKRDKTPKNCGHTITVVSVQYNKEMTEVVGFTCLEGHTGGGKTELNYVSIKPNGKDVSISSYFGANAGVYEVEQNNSTAPENSCIK